MQDNPQEKQTFTIGSQRFYLDEFSKEDRDFIYDTFNNFNYMAEWMYNDEYRKRYMGKPKTKGVGYIKEHYEEIFHKRLSDYYITSLFSVVSGQMAAQKELFKLHEKEQRLRQSRREEKICDLMEQKKRTQEIKTWLIAYSRWNNKSGKKPSSAVLKKNLLTLVGTDQIEYPCYHSKNTATLYKYECMIDQKIKRLDQRIRLIQEKIRVENEKRKTIPPRMTFGGKGFYRSKDTKSLMGKEKAVWHRKREFRRTNRVLFSGRRTSSYGNYLIQYDLKTNDVVIHLMDGRTVTLQNVYFPYRGEEFLSLRNREKSNRVSIGYQLQRYIDKKDHREYVVLKAILTYKNYYLNYCKETGVIGMDLNYGFLAWTELSENGNCIRQGTIPCITAGLNSGQAASVIGHACRQLLCICEETKKPLIMEDLDFVARKGKMAYGNKESNQKLSSFA